VTVRDVRLMGALMQVEASIGGLRRRIWGYDVKVTPYVLRRTAATWLSRRASIHGRPPASGFINFYRTAKASAPTNGLTRLAAFYQQALQALGTGGV
jgi:hypothetical protein